jgi:hypothetical protein
MESSIALAPRIGTVWRRAHSLTRRLDADPQAANLVLLGSWGITRLALVLGMVLGRHFCDPYFYHYAGQFAAGRWPYHDVQVEYPPLAMVLLLLPALVLLPFSSLAPRPDAAFSGVITQIPQPDIVRYSAYGLAFAVEMLLIDVFTLWLVRVAAKRFLSRDPQGWRAGLLYVAIIFLNGALLQKFDLAAGTLVLAAVLALIEGHRRWAWLALAGAALVKGFPILLLPLFALYLVNQARGASEPFPWRAVVEQMKRGLVWCGGAIALVTLPIALWAGIEPIWHTIAYHAERGTEIESLYANVMLALGWLPHLGVTTAFSAADLSRVVVSPLDRFSDLASYLLLAAFLVAAYVVSWRVWGAKRRMAGAGELPDASAYLQMFGFTTAAVLLAFVLTFRALPAHYLLVIAPIAALLRLPRRRSTSLWLGGVATVAIVGQLITMIWSSLRLLVPWAVAVLSVRNAVWLLLFALALAAPFLWRRALVPAVVTPNAGAVSVRTRFRRRWRRLLASTPPIPGFSPREEDVAAHLLSHISPGALVLGAGLCSTLMYALLVRAFPLTLLYSHPHVGNNTQLINDMGRITGYSPLAAFGFVGAVLALFVCQFLALVAAGRIAPRRGTSHRDEHRFARYAMLLFPVAFILIMIWMQPVTTTDLYGYVARGFLFVFKHANPMTTPANQLPGGLQVGRPAAPYGPLWLLIAAAVSRVAGQNLLANMVAFKVIEAAATIAALLLVDVLARRLFPRRRLRILVLFGWSPLLIFEAIGNGHNDIVMMVCVLAGFICMLRGRARTAFALFVLGALVKYVAAICIPLWLVYELRRSASVGPARSPTDEMTGEDASPASGIGDLVLGQARAIARTLQEVDRRRAANLIASAIVIGGGLVAIAYAPFWEGFRTFTGLGQQLRPLYYNSSVVAFLTAPLQILVSQKEFGALDKTVRLVFYVLFGIYTLIHVNRLWQRKPAVSLDEVITATAKITLAALILITFWYQPWYVVWLLPVAALSEEPYVRRAATILAAGSLMTYAVSSYLFVGETGLAQSLFVQFFEILVTFGPLLILRAAPNEGGLLSIGRRYVGSVEKALRQNPILWERVMLGLVLIVAALLRILYLGNLFTPIANVGQSQELAQLSNDLGLFLSDPQGLNVAFSALRALLIHVFGPTLFAVLLPSAVIGTLTVVVIYLLTRELMRQGKWHGEEGVALLAALLAATSAWHVSLSRSGMELVLLPLLMCTALYCLLLAFRLGAPPAMSQRASDGKAPFAVARTRWRRRRPPLPSGARLAQRSGGRLEVTREHASAKHAMPIPGRSSGARLDGSRALTGREDVSPVGEQNGMMVGRLPHSSRPSLSPLVSVNQPATAKLAPVFGPAEMASPSPDNRSRRQQCLLLYAGCGVCTGLASDLAPGLWVLPLIVIGFLLAWRWRVPGRIAGLRARIAVLLGSALLSGLPAVGYLVGRQIGFPAGSAIFARTPGKPAPAPSLFSLQVWGNIAQNVASVLHVLITQDYTAGYPAGGNTPIIPVLLAPVFVLGVVIALVRWHNLAAMGLLLLVALPLVASVAVASSPDVIEAACVLPATCIVPAVALYELGRFLGHLPIVLDRINGSRIFNTPEQIGRVLLLIFLVVSTIRTFFWYFEATLPATPPNQYVPTYIQPATAPIAFSDGPLGVSLRVSGDIRQGGLHDSAVAGIVLVHVAD